MNEAKKRRIAEVENRRKIKRMRETLSLSIALLRAVSARSLLEDEARRFNAEGGDATFLVNHADAMNRLTVNGASRFVAMTTLFYASLNVVVEGWTRPKTLPRLTDPKIDALLTPEFLKLLSGFRNAMLHPSPLDDPDLVRFSEDHRHVVRSAQQLCDEFLRFFRNWRESMPPITPITD